ncbi:hypothetical protein [Gynurincola endophyticus]|uniref:hypothetical protein n=1 Tax=Gynurincola endophyticus TaxID=2479004 RepID=UPI000F8C85E9|nr:hypothetical protein [Gynurincola endophyticus]
MKILNFITTRRILLALILPTLLLSACSKDKDDQKDDSNSFMLKDTRYSVNIASLQLQNNSSGMSDAVILLTGGNGSRIGTTSFIVSFSTAGGINGTYTAASGGNVGTHGTYAAHLATYSIQNGGDLQTGGYATGPLKITSHGNNEYSVEFTVKYNDNTEASANIKRIFTIP